MKQLIKKPAFWLIAILIFAIVNVVFAQHIGRFYITPTNDADPIFLVNDEDGLPVFAVNTSTDGAALTGALSVSTTLDVTGNVSFGSTVAGTGTFTSTEVYDTVLISGALATDAYMVSPGIAKGGTIDAQDTQLAYSARADTLIVFRPASGLTALTWSWLRIR